MPATSGVSHRWMVGLLVVAVVAMAGALMLIEPMRVSSGSMSPSYEQGDQVLVSKVGPRSQGSRRGDVIVLRTPRSGALMIKRIAALGGDRVSIEDGVLVVNGRRIAEPYVDRGRVDGTYFGPIRVPRNSVWLLGDSRAGSIDSRTYGPVSLDDIVGRVLVRLW